MFKFGFGDIVRIRNEDTLASVVCAIIDDDETIWYEVRAVGFDAPFNREVRECDLQPV